MILRNNDNYDYTICIIKSTSAVMTMIWGPFMELLVLFILMLASTFTHCCYAIINWIYFYSLLDAQTVHCTVERSNH